MAKDKDKKKDKKKKKKDKKKGSSGLITTIFNFTLKRPQGKRVCLGAFCFSS